MQYLHRLRAALLKTGILMLLACLLLTCWASYSVVKHQAQLASLGISQSTEDELKSAAPSLGISEIAKEESLLSTTHAWWFGSWAKPLFYNTDNGTLYYQLDTGFANRLALQLALPLSIIIGLLFFSLYRRAQGLHSHEQQRLLALLQDKTPTQASASNAVEQHILALHQHQQTQIEQLEAQLTLAQQQSLQDSMTLLGNRFAFRRDLELLLNSDNKLASATLMIVRASALQEINQQQGFQAGDQYLQDIVKLLRKVLQAELSAQCYRISGTDIAVLLKGAPQVLAERLGTAMRQELYHYQYLHQLNEAAYMGFTQLLTGQSAEQVLIRADLALAQAQSGEPNGWSLLLKQDAEQDMGESQWRARLHTMLSNEEITLLVQPAQLFDRNRPGYNEIYTRFPNNSGGFYPAIQVFAMLQRLNMSMLFEQKIIEMIVQQVQGKALVNQSWAINLTPASLQQSAFLIWLERLLQQHKSIASNLVFELDEQVLQHQLMAGKKLLEIIRRGGARYAISNFGQGYGSFRLLKELKPDYVKLEGELLRELQFDSSSQQFLRMIIDLAQRLGSCVIAEGVETHEQKQLLESMHISGIQGYLIAKPSPLAEFTTLAPLSGLAD